MNESDTYTVIDLSFQDGKSSGDHFVPIPDSIFSLIYPNLAETDSSRVTREQENKFSSNFVTQGKNSFVAVFRSSPDEMINYMRQELHIYLHVRRQYQEDPKNDYIYIRTKEMTSEISFNEGKFTSVLIIHGYEYSVIVNLTMRGFPSLDDIPKQIQDICSTSEEITNPYSFRIAVCKSSQNLRGKRTYIKSIPDRLKLFHCDMEHNIATSWKNGTGIPLVGVHDWASAVSHLRVLAPSLTIEFTDEDIRKCVLGPDEANYGARNRSSSLLHNGCDVDFDAITDQEEKIRAYFDIGADPDITYSSRVDLVSLLRIANEKSNAIRHSKTVDTSNYADALIALNCRLCSPEIKGLNAGDTDTLCNSSVMDESSATGAEDNGENSRVIEKLFDDRLMNLSVKQKMAQEMILSFAAELTSLIGLDVRLICTTHHEFVSGGSVASSLPADMLPKSTQPLPVNFKGVEETIGMEGVHPLNGVTGGLEEQMRLLNIPEGVQRSPDALPLSKEMTNAVVKYDSQGVGTGEGLRQEKEGNGIKMSVVPYDAAATSPQPHRKLEMGSVRSSPAGVNVGIEDTPVRRAMVEQIALSPTFTANEELLELALSNSCYSADCRVTMDVVNLRVYAVNKRDAKSASQGNSMNSFQRDRFNEIEGFEGRRKDFDEGNSQPSSVDSHDKRQRLHHKTTHDNSSRELALMNTSSPFSIHVDAALPSLLQVGFKQSYKLETRQMYDKKEERIVKYTEELDSERLREMFSHHKYMCKAVNTKDTEIGILTPMESKCGSFCLSSESIIRATLKKSPEEYRELLCGPNQLDIRRLSNYELGLIANVAIEANFKEALESNPYIYLQLWREEKGRQVLLGTGKSDVSHLFDEKKITPRVDRSSQSEGLNNGIRVCALIRVANAYVDIYPNSFDADKTNSAPIASVQISVTLAQEMPEAWFEELGPISNNHRFMQLHSVDVKDSWRAHNKPYGQHMGPSHDKMERVLEEVEEEERVIHHPQDKTQKNKLKGRGTTNLERSNAGDDAVKRKKSLGLSGIIEERKKQQLFESSIENEANNLYRKDLEMKYKKMDCLRQQGVMRKEDALKETEKSLLTHAQKLSQRIHEVNEVTNKLVKEHFNNQLENQTRKLELELRNQKLSTSANIAIMQTEGQLDSLRQQLEETTLEKNAFKERCESMQAVIHQRTLQSSRTLGTSNLASLHKGYADNNYRAHPLGDVSILKADEEIGVPSSVPHRNTLERIPLPSITQGRYEDDATGLTNEKLVLMDGESTFVGGRKLMDFSYAQEEMRNVRSRDSERMGGPSIQAKEQQSHSAYQMPFNNTTLNNNLSAFDNNFLQNKPSPLDTPVDSTDLINHIRSMRTIIENRYLNPPTQSRLIK